MNRPTKTERIAAEGRWTARTREVFVHADWHEGFAVSRVELNGVKSMSRWIWDLHDAATYCLGTGGLIQPHDVLWLGRALGGEGLDAPSFIVALAAQDLEGWPTPLLRPVWVAQDHLDQGWQDRLVEAVQTYQGSDRVRWDRHPSSYIRPTLAPTRSTT
jgi:hypothetical protein